MASSPVGGGRTSRDRNGQDVSGPGGLCHIPSPESLLLHTRSLLRGDAVVELGLNDYLDIFCPHYEGPGPPGGPESFALYMVDWQGYQVCQAEGPRAFKRWECSRPFAPLGPVRFSEKIQRFTPFSLGFEFLPGDTYYYICE